MVRVVKPEVTLQANEEYTYIADRDAKENAAEAFDVYLNGVKIPYPQDSDSAADDASYTVTAATMNEAGNFQSITYQIKYRIGKDAQDNDRYETIDCAFSGEKLPTIKSHSDEKSETETEQY